MMTLEEIECCRRIGRVPTKTTTTIGLAELDALCDTAAAGVRARRALTTHVQSSRELRAAGFRALQQVSDMSDVAVIVDDVYREVLDKVELAWAL